MVIRGPSVEDDQDQQAQRKDQIAGQAPEGFWRRTSGPSEATPGNPVPSITRTVRFPAPKRYAPRHAVLAVPVACPIGR